jgi:hypothetical protein
MSWLVHRRIAWFVLLAGAEVAEAASFETAIKPVFEAKCLACHGAAAMGKLDLRTPEAVLKGGESGAVVKPGAWLSAAFVSFNSISRAKFSIITATSPAV